MTGKRKHVFGPVFSRRLGRSLGIDAVPLKTCTYDCVYCQLGKTPVKTAEIKEYVSPGEIMEELAAVLGVGVKADYITLSGSGEPTLNKSTGEIISGIKNISDIPVCVITNGSLLFLPRVRENLLGADLVIPSLDAAEDETFLKINRPHESVDFRRMAGGIASFSGEFSGKLQLEVMLVRGINDSEENLKKLGALAEQINPCKIQINTAVRPPSRTGIKRACALTLERAAEIFGEKAEIIAPPAAAGKGAAGAEKDVLEAIKRRPFTAGEISSYLGLDISETLKRIAKLLREGALISEDAGGETYYKYGRR